MVPKTDDTTTGLSLNPGSDASASSYTRIKELQARPPEKKIENSLDHRAGQVHCEELPILSHTAPVPSANATGAEGYCPASNCGDRQVSKLVELFDKGNLTDSCGHHASQDGGQERAPYTEENRDAYDDHHMCLADDVNAILEELATKP